MGAPLAFAPDTLINNELGWKTSGWVIAFNGMVRSIRRNGITFRLVRSMRVSRRQPSMGVITGYVASRLPSVARAAGLTVEAGVAWNHSELVKQAAFLGRTEHRSISARCKPRLGKIANPAGHSAVPRRGPDVSGQHRARYEFAMDAYRAFAQIGAVHQSHSLSTTDQFSRRPAGQIVAYDLPAFTTYDAALGAGKDGWVIQVYGENLTDTRAELFANYAQGTRR